MKWWNKGILFFTIIILIALAGSYFAIYISPEDFWPIAFLGLAYLPLFIVFLLPCIYWLFVRRQLQVQEWMRMRQQAQHHQFDTWAIYSR